MHKVMLPPASGPEYEKLLALCREHNEAGHDDPLVINAATRMHWKLVWAQDHHQGKKASIRHTRDDVTVTIKPGARDVGPMTDVRRMHDRLAASDINGFGKAWSESRPYTQELVRGALWKRDPSTRLFRSEVPVTPSDYAAVLAALSDLLDDHKLKGRPRTPAADEAVRSLQSLLAWLTGRPIGGLHGSDPPQGPTYDFVYAVSEAYGMQLVTDKSANRLRGTRALRMKSDR